MNGHISYFSNTAVGFCPVTTLCIAFSTLHSLHCILYITILYITILYITILYIAMLHIAMLYIVMLYMAILACLL